MKTYAILFASVLLVGRQVSRQGHTALPNSMHRVFLRQVKVKQESTQISERAPRDGKISITWRLARNESFCVWDMQVMAFERDVAVQPARRGRLAGAHAAKRRCVMAMREVYFLLLPRVMSLDVSGPAEVLTLAGGFRLHYIGPQPEVMTSTGLRFGRIKPLPATLPDDSPVFVPGVSDSSKQLDTPQAQSVRHWLQQHRARFHSRCWTLVCICSGALLAARAGLLDGYCCTTHHQVMARLRQQAPAALLRDNRIFVKDRGLFTSAGITAGIDLALHLVSQYVGPQVAREMVVYFRRGGDDPQLSPWLRYRNHLHPAIHRAQDILAREPETDWHLEQRAKQVFMSGRHLSRLFRLHYHEQLRLAVAEQRLQQGMGKKAALCAGFSSARQLRRAQARRHID